MQYRHPRHHHPLRDVAGKICYGSIKSAVKSIYTMYI